MSGTKDNINQLVEDIESQGFNFVLGIIKKSKSLDNIDEIEIFTNGSDDGLKKLLLVLREHQKSVKVKKDKENPF